MQRIEILISGYGGQGVVRIGQILGQASVDQGLFTTMLISHGTETRGGYVRSQLVLSEGFIASPVVEKPDYFCAFSSAAYEKFKGICGAGTSILHNPALVPADPALAAQHLAVAAEALAQQEFGNQIFANVVFLGALSRILTLIEPAHILRALVEKIPRFSEDNIRAFHLGRAALRGN